MTKQRKRQINKNDYGPNFVPPDGGFGWFICVGAGISNMWMFCLFQNFGLIYGAKFDRLNLTSAQITTIPNTQTAIAYFVGFLAGLLLKRFTYRQVGLLGSLCFSIGVFCTSFSNSFTMCLISYGWLVGIGAGLCFPANALAINTYFKERRRIAHSIAWTITGVGQIFMPALITILLNRFDVIQVSEIISALCLHMFACTLLYQPVLWHTEKSNKLNGLESEFQPVFQNDNAERQEAESTEPKNDSEKLNDKKRSWTQKVVIFFDLDLLKDPTFLNIELGMIFPYLAEINFAVLTPIFLREFGFSREEIILVMTLPAFSDILGRLALPLLFGKFKIEPRYFYLLGLFGQMTSILVIAMAGSDYYKTTLVAFLVFGLFKGLKTVYMQLILPDFVPLARLSGAVGLNNLLTGLFALFVGSQIGGIRDRSNYVWLLYSLVFMMFVPVLSWITEFAVKTFRTRK